MENLYENIKRFTPDISTGLSTIQVRERIEQGLSNLDDSIPVKTVKQIIKDNVLTLFNLINIIIATAILYVGSYKNLMFMGVVICNALIGIIQEIRAKKAVDKLSLISQKGAKVIRDGKLITIDVEEIVLDDVILFSSGDQIVTDCIVAEGTCTVNEALLTGEPDLISKKEGDILLSGSYIVGGQCTARTHHVGKQNYTSKILRGTKYVKTTKSQIMSSINKIIKIISFFIIPIGVFLLLNQLKIYDYNYNKAIVTTAAALIGMIPEGLVLLTSTVLAVGVIRLSKKNVLVQDIYCIETLARVDTLCLDKTGTITEGQFEVSKVVPHNNFTERDIENVLSWLVSALNDTNETFLAIKQKFGTSNQKLSAEKIVPFSSEKKWSGAYFKRKGAYVMGAGEFIFKDTYEQIEKYINTYSQEYRVLTIAHSKDNFNGEDLPNNLTLIGIVLIKDKIRPNASETLKYFSEQGVDVKIISGDNPVTVSNIAKTVALKNYDKYIDATLLKDNQDISEAVKKYTIFGRVTPPQKKQIISELKNQGHTVAMTGDGVNDVLALKEADCSISVANGSEAARNISHLVLLDSDFASMPSIVHEGRRAINNIQRSSSLFLVKTIYSAFLAILYLFIPIPYPFVPIQMTLISALTIGIPSFILAMEPNNDRIKGNLFYNIIRKSLPPAITTIIQIILCASAYSLLGFSRNEYSTICVITTGFIGLLLLYRISLPFNTLRKILISFVSISFCVSIIFLKDIFSLADLNIFNCIFLIIMITISLIIHNTITRLETRIFKNRFKF